MAVNEVRVQHGTVRYGAVRYGTVRYGTALDSSIDRTRNLAWQHGVHGVPNSI